MQAEIALANAMASDFATVAGRKIIVKNTTQQTLEPNLVNHTTQENLVN